MHTKVQYSFFNDSSLTPVQQDATAVKQNADLEAIGLKGTNYPTTSPTVTVIEGSPSERALLEYLTAIRAVVYNFGTECPSQRGQQVVCKHRSLVLDEIDDSCGYVLGSHLGYYLGTDEDPEWPPWFVHTGVFGAPLDLLRCQQSDRRFPKCVGHPDHNYRDQVILAPDVTKRAIEQLQLKGLGFEQVAPVILYDEVTDDSQPVEYTFFVFPRRTHRFRNIMFGSYPPDLPPWWVPLPSITLPPVHPLLLRSSTLSRNDIIHDPHYRGPVKLFSKLFDSIPLIYTPEAVAAMPPFDIAMTYEQGQFGKYSGRIIVSERGKELLSPYLVEPHWARVGILPANSPVLGGSG
jgi:hypothetical protein